MSPDTFYPILGFVSVCAAAFIALSLYLIEQLKEQHLTTEKLHIDMNHWRLKYIREKALHADLEMTAFPEVQEHGVDKVTLTPVQH